MKITKTLSMIFVVVFLFGSGMLYSSHRLVVLENVESFPKQASTYEKINCLTSPLLPLPVSEKTHSQAIFKHKLITAGNKREPTTDKKIQASIEILNQASARGILNKSTQARLDELAMYMDDETNVYLWEQVLEDVKAGKYQLSDDEISAHNSHLLVNEGEEG